MKIRLIGCLLWILMVSCREKQQTLFSLLPSSQTGVKFENTIHENDDFNLIDYYYVYNGGGVSAGDINNDGLPDLYFTGNQVSDKLYLNKGKGENGELHFEDITAAAGIKTGGWSTGVTMADVNSDGLMDIYVCKSGNYPADKRKNQLYLNKGNMQFEESAARLGIADTTFTNQAAFLDYDKDGDLDLFLITSTNLVRNPNKLVAPVNDGTGLSADRLYRNDGDKFTDVSKNAGIVHDGMSLGLSVADFNGDGWDDIMVGNDFLSSDLLYLNNQDGTFRESAREAFGHHSQFTMGTDAADFNNDGKVDLMTVDMLPADNEQRKLMAGPANFQQFEMARQLGYHPQYMRNMLQLNAGAGKGGEERSVHFSEIGQFSGVHSTDWSWSPLFADFDNDGFKDLCITNGYLRDITDLDFVAYNAEMAQGGASKEVIDNRMKAEALKMKTLKKNNFIYQNNGDLTFANKTKEWFGDAPSLSNGSAYADLDGDGDLDLVVNNINQEAFIFQNNTTGKNFLNINLKGKRGNANGLGAEVTLYTGGGLQQINHSVTRGYQSSSDYQVHFGLGSAKLTDSVRVVWPDGKSQTVQRVNANQVLTLNYQNATQVTRNKQVTTPILKDVTLQTGIDYLHKEEPYMDYNQEPMLLHMLSRQGPKMAVGDVDGDGLEDFYIGGSYRHQGSFYIQNAFGKFIPKPIKGVTEQKDEEDTGVLLADLDGDQDLDLYIVSGSNEYFDGSEYYQDRMYLNDGRGNFTAALNMLPAIRHSGSCIVAADFDHDGDLDLFRGGRLMPLGYPKAGESCILRNDNGHFTDVTDSVAPQLRNIGMVTDAVWADMDNDSWPDLMLTGELMPLTLYKNIKGKLSNANSFPSSNGFWNCVKAADFDRDGDLDFVAGNLGLNSRYRFSKAAPMSIYSADLDANGRYDAIPSYFLNGTEYPVPSRDELTRQIPVFKKRFQSYALYSKIKMSELLTAEQQKAVTVSKAFVQQSVYIENKGAGKFELKPLPQIAQLSVVQDILIDDVDGDGNPDILLAGNDYTTEPGAGQYDASYGVFLKGNGKGSFQPVATDVSGFFVNGDCRSIRKITGKRSYYVVSRNKAGIVVFAKK